MASMTSMMTVIENPSRDPAFNLAAEEYLLTNRTDGDFLMLWVNSPAVVIGKFQNPWVEVSLASCEERGVPVIRRNSGGGCVYHDPGNLNYTILTDRRNEVSYDRFLTPVVKALNNLGVPAKIAQTSAIEADGFKISGNAQSNAKSRILHHGTLLFDADLDVLGQLTGHARGNFSSKAIASNPSPVANLRPMLRQLGNDMTLSEFAACLQKELAGSDAPAVAFSTEEMRKIESLAEEKYRSWEWTFGRTAAFEACTASGKFRVEHGIIASCADPSLSIEVQSALVGQRFTIETIRRLLGEEAVRELF